jgi:hypothetical protein
MDDATLEVGHAFPLGRVAFGVAVVALAHPEEARRDAEGLAGVETLALDGPAIVGARPGRRGDAMAIADVAREVVLLDHLAHVVQDLLGRGDRLAGPRLEAIAEGVEVAVGADAGIAMGDPRPAVALLRFEHDEARAGALLGQVIGAAHAGDAGADDQDVEMLGGRGG